jgi:hypothetical protein
VNGGRRRPGRPTRRARPVCGAFRSPLTALIVAISLIAQLIAVPYHRAAAAPELARLETAAIAAELKATFGDAAALCAHVDDVGAPSPLSPARHCDDQCQLCRFSAQTATLIAPDAPALPARLETDRQTIAAASDSAAFPACPTKRTRARAPPLAV